jgi:type I restriction enzyme S subunit
MAGEPIASSWIKCRLGDVLTLINGRAYKKHEMIDAGVPILRIQNLNGGNNWFYSDLKLQENKYCHKGDLLFAWSATFGPYWAKWEKTIFHYHIWNIIPSDAMTKEFAFYELLRITKDIKAAAHGVAMPHITKGGMEDWKITLPPIAEQKRIVEKLDSLLAQVETIQQRLNNLPKIIKRFRQSVLAAAVSGKLTEQWRGDSDYQATNIGFEIPASWNLFEIQNIGEVKGGKRLPKGEELVPEDTGYRYVRAGQLKNGTIVNGDMARNSQMYLKAHVQEQIKRYIVNEGDAYITIVGASIGDAGVIPANYDGANLTENAAKICEFSRPMNSDFIGFWLRSQLIQQLIRLEIKSGAQGKLALKRIKTLPIPNISIQEQTEIVRLVEQHFALADTLEKNLKNAKQKVDNLTQSILAKAFRGELVPQDPNDEPAEQLLARIKTARAEAELLEKTVKKAAKAKK